MTYLLVAAAVLALLVWRGRTPKAPRWRVPAVTLGVVVLAAAAFEAIRGGETPAGLLALIGFAMLGAARWVRPASPTHRASLSAPAGTMGLAEARATLGVNASATPQEIRAAHARLIRVAHPDHGGTAGLAAQLNAARDRLLKGRAH